MLQVHACPSATVKAPLPTRPRVAPGNRLIAALPRKDHAHLVGECEDVPLPIAEVLFEAGHRLRHVHFPTVGFISLLAPIDGSSHLEVGLVGDEGMVGTPLILGIDTSPLRALVQGAGRSLRMPAAAFRRELRRSAALKGLLDQYLFVRMTQLAQTAGCTRFHLVEARLARWLLMTQDRAHSDTFHITHDFLASMLGVRRAGVTQAARSLHKRGLIRYQRGDMAVIDRPGLEAASCTCYLADREAHRLVLG
jgi:CRP-like cAMP-binding protein